MAYTTKSLLKVNQSRDYWRNERRILLTKHEHFFEKEIDTWYMRLFGTVESSDASSSSLRAKIPLPVISFILCCEHGFLQMHQSQTISDTCTKTLRNCTIHHQKGLSNGANRESYPLSITEMAEMNSIQISAYYWIENHKFEDKTGN